MATIVGEHLPLPAERYDDPSRAPTLFPAPPSAEPPPEAPTLTVLTGLPVASHPLPIGQTVAGRSADADLQLSHAEISRRHCRFEWDGGEVCTLEDLGSRWGTKVNGSPVTGDTCVPLKPGDRIHLGPLLIHYGVGPLPPAGASPPPGVEDGDEPGSLAELLGPRALIDEHEADVIPLGERVRFGRVGGDVDVILADASISRLHAVVEQTPEGYTVTDQRSRAGSLVNGRRFEKHDLVIGDQLQMGPFFFRFDGRALVRTLGRVGVEIDARHLRQVRGAVTILDDVNLHIERGQFVAILGPSGSGKSSLIDTLTGLQPADAGSIRYDGVEFYREYDRLRPLLGYVPQEDIVHPELTAAAALFFSAKLRLPVGTPELEIRKLVAQTISRLGLEDRTDVPLHRLSGGQRKRVSVGVELLSRPAVLFLDEPTSGLDPASEFKLMELLRHLADGGCTVVCATHVMENVHLADRLFVIDGGRIVFRGTAQETRDFFGVQKLTLLYDRLAERTPAEWQEDFRRAVPDADGSAPSSQPRGSGVVARLPKPAPEQPMAALAVLLARQWAILCMDWKEFLMLFGQPLVIALLVGWVSDNTSLSLFFAYLATLWFGCSNAAGEIVREIPIYRRERMAGLGRHAYLLSKFTLLGALTAGQGIFLYACLWLVRWNLYPDALPERGLDGSTFWQVGSVVCTAFAAVGIGFGISALARSAMQAVMIVPLVLIPQILFSGLVVNTGEMSPSVLALTSAMPSYAAQTMMDVGAFWHQPIDGELYLRREKARDHLTDLLRRELAHRLPPEQAGHARELANQAFALGKTYDRADLAILAAFKLVAWTLVGYLAAWCGLRMKERG